MEEYQNRRRLLKVKEQLAAKFKLKDVAARMGIDYHRLITIFRQQQPDPEFIEMLEKTAEKGLEYLDNKGDFIAQYDAALKVDWSKVESLLTQGHGYSGRYTNFCREHPEFDYKFIYNFRKTQNIRNSRVKRLQFLRIIGYLPSLDSFDD